MTQDHISRALMHSKCWMVSCLLFVAAAQPAAAAIQMPAPTEVSIRTLKEGAGARITARDGVVINYIGRLSDGRVFDNNWGGTPASLLIHQVIPGFGEAPLKMREGGHYEISIPANLAYGAKPPPGSIVPPNADLTFDVVVLTVVANAAEGAVESD